MLVNVEQTSELSRKMTVTISEAVVQEKMEVHFKKLAREVKVDGFRPGKVPVSMVKKIYGDRVKGDVNGDLIQSTYFEALQQQNLNPAGYPSVQPVDTAEGFEYVAEFEVYPEITLTGVAGLKVSRPQSTVTDADVDAMIDKLRQQKKTWKTLKRKSKTGDKLTIHFSGTQEGENFTDGKVENYAVEIGANQMIPGFEKELKGLNPGDSKTFKITFPEKYNSEKLAGKEAEFEIEVVSVEEPVLPELDVDFIKAYGVDSGDLETFRADVKGNMERELAQGLKNKLKNNVMDALIDGLNVSVPNALVDQEIQELMRPYADRAKQMRLKLEDLQLPRDMFESQAKRRVTLGLILGEIISQNQLDADDAKVRAVIEDMAKSYEKPEEVVAWYFGDKKRLVDVQQMVLEDQAVDWVVNQASVTDQQVGFNDVMEKQ